MSEYVVPELRLIAVDLGAMCATVATAMEGATKALLERDLVLAERVISDDVHADELRADIEDRAYVTLATRTPDVVNPRAVISAIHAATDLERMGDLARHVAEAARRRHPGPVLPDEVREHFAEMGRVAVGLAWQAREVIDFQDADRAARLEFDDDVMDELHRSIFVVLGARGWPHGVAAAVDVTLLSRFYERYADHAVAVARRVASAVTGRDVPHTPRPRLTYMKRTARATAQPKRPEM